MSQKASRFYQPYRPSLKRQYRGDEGVQSPNLRIPRDDNNNISAQDNFEENDERTSSHVKFLSEAGKSERFSLVDMGRSFLVDRHLSSMEYVQECLSPSVVQLGSPNLMELNQLYSSSCNPELRTHVALIAGSELLSLHRCLSHKHLEEDMSGIHRMVRRQHLEPSCFGDSSPSIPFSYTGVEGIFNCVNFNEEYDAWKLSLGQHLSEDTKIRHFLKQMLKKVVVNASDIKKLTARVREGNDGLIPLPLKFRSILKAFLHSAGRDQDGAFAISLDAMISSMVKELRRCSDRSARRRL